MQNRALVTSVIVVLLAAACSPAAQPPTLSESGQQEAATIVAATMQVLPTAPPSPIPAASATPEQGQPILTITANSNCRTGPGGGFEVVTSFTTGTKLDIVGQNSDNNFWEVKIPNSDETCWVWGRYATATGNLADVPESAPPASGASNVPAPPGDMFFQFTCSGNTIEVSLSWSDAADNESGYHVYRDDTLLADLPPDSGSYEDSLSSPTGATLKYEVAAYNDSGESARRVQMFSACQ